MCMLHVSYSYDIFMLCTKKINLVIKNVISFVNIFQTILQFVLEASGFFITASVTLQRLIVFAESSILLWLHLNKVFVNIVITWFGFPAEHSVSNHRYN